MFICHRSWRSTKVVTQLISFFEKLVYVNGQSNSSLPNWSILFEFGLRSWSFVEVHFFSVWRRIFSIFFSQYFHVYCSFFDLRLNKCGYISLFCLLFFYVGCVAIEIMDLEKLSINYVTLENKSFFFWITDRSVSKFAHTQSIVNVVGVFRKWQSYIDGVSLLFCERGWMMSI